MNDVDKDLLSSAQRAPFPWEMSDEECAAINVLKRDGVSVTILAIAFGRSRNAIYSNCITGTAPSYPLTRKAPRIEELVDKLGVDEARRRYVTPAMVKAVDRAHKKKIASFRKAKL